MIEALATILTAIAITATTAHFYILATQGRTP